MNFATSIIRAGRRMYHLDIYPRNFIRDKLPLFADILCSPQTRTEHSSIGLVIPMLSTGIEAL